MLFPAVIARNSEVSGGGGVSGFPKYRFHVLECCLVMNHDEYCLQYLNFMVSVRMRHFRESATHQTPSSLSLAFFYFLSLAFLFIPVSLSYFLTPQFLFLFLSRLLLGLPLYFSFSF